MFFGSILNRMIFWELVRVFLLSLASLTGLFMMVALIQQANQLGISASQALAIMPLSIPSTLPYTIPATTLFASCVVYGRLANDNEIVAVKAAGVQLFQILKPALFLGVIATLITAGLYYSVIADTQQQFQRAALSDPEELLYNYIRRDRCLRQPSFPFVIYVRDVQGRRLIDLVIKRRIRNEEVRNGHPAFKPGYDIIARAHEAKLRVDLDEGKMYIDSDRLVFYDKDTQGMNSSNAPYPVPLPEFLTGRDIKTRPMSLSWEQLSPRVEELQAEQRTLIENRELSNREAGKLKDAAGRELTRFQYASYTAQIDEKSRQIRNVRAELYARPAQAFGCLVFAIIGCPVGIWANRSDYLSTFVICFLPAILVYYPLLLAGGNMGKDGKLPMGLGCWLANIVVGVAGVILTYRLLRR